MSRNLLIKSFALVAAFIGMAHGAMAQRDTTILPPPPPIDSLPPTNTNNVYGLSGYVLAPSQGQVTYVRGAGVTLYQLGLNSNATFRVETDSNGHYAFRQLPAGRYIIRAAVGRRNPFFETVLPTYQGGGVEWSNAWVLNIPMRYDTSVYLTMRPRPFRDSTRRGHCEIRGSVRNDSAIVNGRINSVRIAFNFDNAVVRLTGANGFEAFAIPEATTGNYSFGSLADGSYTISVIYPKLTPVTAVVAVAGNSVSQVNFSATQPSAVTSIVRNATQVGSYPNPASSEANILAEGLVNPTITVTSLNGTQVTVPASVNAAGVQLNVKGLKAGIYSVQIAEGSKVFTTKLVKE